MTYTRQDEINKSTQLLKDIQTPNDKGWEVIQHTNNVTKKLLKVIEAYIYSQKINKIPLLTEWSGSSLKQLNLTHNDLIDASKKSPLFSQYLDNKRSNVTQQENKIFEKIILLAGFDKISDENLKLMVKNLKYQRISQTTTVNQADIEREINSRCVNPHIGLYGSNGPISMTNAVTNYSNKFQKNPLSTFRQQMFFQWRMNGLLSEIIEMKYQNKKQFKNIQRYLGKNKLNIDVINDISSLEPKHIGPMFRNPKEFTATAGLRVWNDNVYARKPYDIQNPPPRLGDLSRSEIAHYTKYDGKIVEGRDFFKTINTAKQQNTEHQEFKYNKIVCDNKLPQTAGISTSAYRAYKTCELLNIPVNDDIFERMTYSKDSNVLLCYQTITLYQKFVMEK